VSCKKNAADVMKKSVSLGENAQALLLELV
jgi:hypothetical protein